MESSLPYLVSPGSIKTALERIKQAATPERVTGDFVMTKLNIKGGTGKAIIPFLKKLGFVASDGSPTDLYRRYRNASSSGAALAEGIKIGYKKLLEHNEYFYELGDKDLLGLINQVTGAEASSPISKLTLSTYKNVRQGANFEQASGEAFQTPTSEVPAALTTFAPEQQTNFPIGRQRAVGQSGMGLNLAYTINLNLPASSDQAVFNAIFKSLREHLLDQPE